MNSETSGYDPMSAHADTDAMYSTPEMRERMRILSILAGEKTQRPGSRKKIENAQVNPELFGSTLPAKNIKTDPTELNDDAAAEDEFPIVDNG